MRWLTALGVLALAGCGLMRSEAPQTPQAICESQANDDPVVKQIIIKMAGNAHYQIEGQDQLSAAKQDAITACLRKRGILPPGGVERRKGPYG